MVKCNINFEYTDGEVFFTDNINSSKKFLSLMQVLADNALWACPEIVDAVIYDNRKRCSTLVNCRCWYPSKQRANKTVKNTKLGKHHCCNDINIKSDDNSAANEAIKKVVFGSLFNKNPAVIKEWDACHICQSDDCPDSIYPYDHHTNLANLILLPRALHSFTHFNIFSNYLKYRSYELYGYCCCDYCCKENSMDCIEKPEGYNKIKWPDPVCHDIDEVKNMIERRQWAD